MQYSFAIIGGGLTATSLLCQLTDKLSAMGRGGKPICQRLALVIFEKGRNFGPGVPHSSAQVLDCHITNMCAKDMSVRCKHVDDFHQWLLKRTNTGNKSQRLGVATETSYSSFKECLHYPRGIMGEYLQSRFDQAVQTARELGISVALHPQREVVELTPQKPGFLLRLDHGGERGPTTCSVQGVLLATGHWSETSKYEHYYPTPWPAQRLLEKIPPGGHVGILGSSLSAIEVALTLSSDGQFVRGPGGKLRYSSPNNPRKMTFYSRNGLLPGVRGLIGQRDNRFLTCERIRELIKTQPGAVKLATVFHLLGQELQDAYGSQPDWQQLLHGCDDPQQTLEQGIDEAKKGDGPGGELLWQTLLAEIFPVVRMLYLNLSLQERERFDRSFSTVFFMHAATQPLINAEKLLALMKRDIVTLVRLGTDYSFDFQRRTHTFQFSYTGQDGQIKRDGYRYLVNASGQSRSIETDPSPLIQNLLKQKLVQTIEYQHRNDQRVWYKTGSILVAPDSHQVIQPQTGTPDPQRAFFAVGAMTRGQMIDASMAHGLASSTATVADQLIACLISSEANQLV